MNTRRKDQRVLNSNRGATQEKANFILSVWVQVRYFANQRSVLDAQHAHRQRPHAELILLPPSLPAARKETSTTRGELCQLLLLAIYKQKLVETTRPVSQISGRENCEFWMLTLAASSYAIGVIAHEAKPRQGTKPRDPHSSLVHTVYWPSTCCSRIVCQYVVVMITSLTGSHYLHVKNIPITYTKLLLVCKIRWENMNVNSLLVLDCSI
jgi:hypothetical protein